MNKELIKYVIGAQIYESFDWGSFPNEKIIGFDKEADEILLAEEQVMRIIQIVNPMQVPKKIKLVSQDELYGVKK